MAILKRQSEEISELYTKQKLSMQQIAQRIGISASGVRYHLEKNNIKRRALNDAITYLYLTKFNKMPFKQKRSLSVIDRELKLSGIMLYWGEGTKGGNSVKFTNSDPEMIKLFLKFLRRICGVDENRLKVQIHCYPNQNQEDLLDFWSRTTQIPIERFYRSNIHQGRSGLYKKKSIYGTLAISYCDYLLLKLINSWIDKYKKS